ncbi:MAG: Outer membrane protein OprJ [Herbaspirillum frisingense]|uniref:Outer membrane protein OprJ n=1 Tax=Herbaspirillum frisingense TaxID=92645 RepID=A0A7V8FVE5_9BURK|nr:MAG: Outer membrane protein OprJ [Herbaspirillum frisingense]
MKVKDMDPKVTSLTRAFACAGLLCALAACSLAPVYERPQAALPAQWKDASAWQQNNPAVVDGAAMAWREFVTDPALRSLIALTLEKNLDLRQAVLNIEAARLQYRVQRADRFPGVNAQGSANRQRLPADLSSTGAAQTQGTYQAGIAMTSFELDLFGRVRNLSEAAQEAYFAVQENANAARIALVAETIQAYVTRRGKQQANLLACDTLRSREISLRLLADRRQAGTLSLLDYNDASGLVEQARADVERTQRELAQAEHALTLLAAGADIESFLGDASSGVLMMVEDISPGAPSALLTYRPDIRAAEHELRARNANIGAARAAFFPQITLTGSYGSSSAQLSNLFRAEQESWSFLPQLTIPIFSGGRLQAELDLASVRKDIAVIGYEKAIRTAFRETSDALVAVDTLRREEAARSALAETSGRTLSLAKARYEAGVDGYLRYLDAQRTSFTNRLALIEVSTQRQIALANLYKSLGGGWFGDKSGGAG